MVAHSALGATAGDVPPHDAIDPAADGGVACRVDGDCKDDVAVRGGSKARRLAFA